jgi:hypothetical protein
VDRSFDDHDVEYSQAGERSYDTDAVAEETRRGGHREVFYSRTVYRDGAPVTMEEVLVIDDDEDDAEDDEPRDGYERELWWRNLTRGDLRAVAGRWRAKSKLHARKRYCLMCDLELVVKPRGRPPKTCGPACRKRLERHLDAMSRNAPISRRTVRARRGRPSPEEPEPLCTCVEIRSSGAKGRCSLHGIYFNPPPRAPKDTSGARVAPGPRLAPLAAYPSGRGTLDQPERDDDGQRRHQEDGAA